MNDQDKALRWHQAALILAVVLVSWEAFGLWGHHWLRRRRTVEASIERANAAVDKHIHRN